MRKVILGVAVTLDGFIEGPKGEYDWCLTDQDYGLSDFFKRVDTIFVGRKSYEMSLGLEGGIEGFPTFKEYIFSTTLHKVKAGATLVRDNIQAEVEKIKNEPGKDIWLFGGAEIISLLMNLQLVDEIILAIHPVILGSGKALFSEIKERTWLTLTDHKIYPNGLVFLTYTLKRQVND